jgi:23S rRNA (cytosine1962-C5)-methyltransferase
MVNKKAEAALAAGHPWVYENDLLSSPGETPENGSFADVVSPKGAWLGTGFVSLQSKIRVRIFSRNANDTFDAEFWRRRIRYAWDYRKTVLAPDDLTACRVIFGEADQFPGLTVDRFGGILVTETLSVGMERLKPLLFPLLAEVLRADGQTIDGIYERNDEPLRAKEGLAQNKGWFLLPGETPPASTETEICENGIYYHVDFENGQKTGFFLDQKYNRRAVARLAAGHTVLDCFTHTGSFALNAAKGGAARVTAADISESAIEMARRNAARNSLSNMDFVCEDTFELLPRLAREGCPYDFIILDPPAFTKARKTAENAMRGYKEINYRAMQLLPRGGYLATASCSHFASESMFRQMLAAAAHDAHRQLRQIEVRQQSPDHPVLWGVPETAYLKFFLFQVI